MERGSALSVPGSPGREDWITKLVPKKGLVHEAQGFSILGGEKVGPHAPRQIKRPAESVARTARLSNQFFELFCSLTRRPPD